MSNIGKSEIVTAGGMNTGVGKTALPKVPHPKMNREQLAKIQQNKQQTQEPGALARDSVTRARDVMHGSPYAQRAFTGQLKTMPNMAGQNMMMGSMAMSGQVMNMLALSGVMGNQRQYRMGGMRYQGGMNNYQSVNDVNRLMEMLNQKKREQTGITQSMRQVNQQSMSQRKVNLTHQKKMNSFGKMEKSYGMKKKFYGMKQKMMQTGAKSLTMAGKALSAAAKGLDAAAKAVEAAASAAAAIPVVGTAIAAVLRMIAKMIQMIAKMLNMLAKKLQLMAKKMEASAQKMGVQKNKMGVKQNQAKAKKIRAKTDLQKSKKKMQDLRKQSQILTKDLAMNHRHQQGIQQRLQKLGRKTDIRRDPFGRYGGSDQILGMMQMMQGMPMQQSFMGQLGAVNSMAQSSMRFNTMPASPMPKGTMAGEGIPKIGGTGGMMTPSV